MGANGRYLAEGVRNMVRVSHSKNGEDRERTLPVAQLDHSKSGLVGADRWRVGLVRLAAQEQGCKQQRREGAVEQ